MYRRILVVQKKILHEILGWSINWEIMHSKVKGIQCNEDILEAVYKSKRSAVSIEKIKLFQIVHTATRFQNIWFSGMKSIECVELAWIISRNNTARVYRKLATEL